MTTKAQCCYCGEILPSSCVRCFWLNDHFLVYRPVPIQTKLGRELAGASMEVEKSLDACKKAMADYVGKRLFYRAMKENWTVEDLAVAGWECGLMIDATFVKKGE